MKLFTRTGLRLRLATHRFCNVLTVLTVFILSFSSLAHADRRPLAVTNIEFLMEIKEWSCKIKNSSQNLVVDLGVWNTRDLNKVGTKTKATYFEIELEDCNVEQVAMSFTGPASSSNPNYLALSPNSSAQHLAVQISDHNQMPLPLNSVSPAAPVNQQNNSSKLSFYANFISTQERIEAGHATADATLVLHYN